MKRLTSRPDKIKEIPAGDILVHVDKGSIQKAISDAIQKSLRDSLRTGGVMGQSGSEKFASGGYLMNPPEFYVKFEKGAVGFSSTTLRSNRCSIYDRNS